MQQSAAELLQCPPQSPPPFIAASARIKNNTPEFSSARICDIHLQQVLN